MRSVVPLFVPGLLFGSGLAVSGMTDPRKIIAFLDLAGDWDPSLLFVMVGALATFALLRLTVRRRTSALLGGPMPTGPAAPIDGRMIVGASLFGVGWGLGGLCPGPALTSLAGGHAEAATFVAAMAVGVVIAQRLLGADRQP